MKIEKHVDWLSVTISSELEWRNFIPFVDIIRNGKGRHGYAKAYLDRRTGARIETDAHDPKMGTHLTLTGDCLMAMRQELGMIDDALMERIQQWDGKVSRIDLAIDARDTAITPKKLASALQEGNAHIRARVWRLIEGHRNGQNGDTVDTGSNKSDKRLRVYDKRAEQGLADPETWIRFEIQLRRVYANAVVQNCTEYGVERTVSAEINNYLRWDEPEYIELTGNETTAVTTIGRKATNRQKWLLGQVAQALAAELESTPGFDYKFWCAVKAFREAIGGENLTGN